jgi:hypothetical protein
MSPRQIHSDPNVPGRLQPFVILWSAKSSVGASLGSFGLGIPTAEARRLRIRPYFENRDVSEEVRTVRSSGARHSHGMYSPLPAPEMTVSARDDPRMWPPAEGTDHVCRGFCA